MSNSFANASRLCSGRWLFLDPDKQSCLNMRQLRELFLAFSNNTLFLYTNT